MLMLAEKIKVTLENQRVRNDNGTYSTNSKSELN